MMMIPWVAVWVVLAAVVVALAVYRKVVSLKEDDTLHIDERESGLVVQQVEVARRLDVVDRWGQILTVVVLVYGLLLGSAYLYTTWIERNTSALSAR
jgi:hypothetical protein